MVWFGEPVPLYQEALKRMIECDLIIICGTSLEVSPVNQLPEAIPYNVSVYIIDPGDVNLPERSNTTHIKCNATAGMQKVIELIKSI